LNLLFKIREKLEGRSLVFKPSEIRIAFEACKQLFPNIRDKDIRLVIMPWGIPSAWMAREVTLGSILSWNLISFLMGGFGVGSILGGQWLGVAPLLLMLAMGLSVFPSDIEKRPTIVMPIFNPCYFLIQEDDVWSVTLHEMTHISDMYGGARGVLIAGFSSRLMEETRATEMERCWAYWNKGYRKLRYLFEGDA
jgi:hypothetical protein